MTRKITPKERKILYAMLVGSKAYISEKSLRSQIGSKSSIQNALNNLMSKNFLDRYDPERNGTYLYFFSRSVDTFKLKDRVRPKYNCKKCKRRHNRDSMMGEEHLKYKR